MKPMDDAILDILAYRKRHDLARLLKGSSYELNVSNSYGSRFKSLLTTVQVYTPIQNFDRLKQLPDKDHRDIIEAFQVIYPVRDEDIEIFKIEFFINPDSPIPTPITDVTRLKEIDFAYINEQIAKCDEKIQTADFEGAITTARNLVESVCKYILDETHQDYERTEDLPDLYKKVATFLNMDPSKHEEKAFKQVLSGCFGIINGLANIRNELGDAHGKSRLSHHRPKERHAVLSVGVAKVLSEYLYSSFRDHDKRC